LHNFWGAFCLSTVAGACSSVDIASFPKCRATIAIAAAIYGVEREEDRERERERQGHGQDEDTTVT